MSDKKRSSYWVLLIDAILAAVCANQIAAPPFHHLNRLGEIAVFGAVLVFLIYIDRLAAQRGWATFGRAALKAALFAGILLINIVSSMQHCDRWHENCHRVFFS